MEKQQKKEKTIKSFEKKLKPYQKIAIERIYRLFEIIEKTKDPKLNKRYLTIVTNISKKCEVSIPKELKKKYCKKCLSTKIKLKEELPFIIVLCEECGFKKKYQKE